MDVGRWKPEVIPLQCTISSDSGQEVETEIVLCIFVVKMHEDRRSELKVKTCRAQYPPPAGARGEEWMGWMMSDGSMMSQTFCPSAKRKTQRNSDLCR